MADPRSGMPLGAVDSHVHVYDPDVPFHDGADLQPKGADLEAYLNVRTGLGLQRSVFVQPSSYGFDNTSVLRALRRCGSESRGVVVVDMAIDENQLKEMHVIGVRGVRINLIKAGGLDADSLEAMADKIAPFGWHLQLHGADHHWIELADRLHRLEVSLVIDHMGRLPGPNGLENPARLILESLLEAGHSWLKISGPYFGSSDHEGYSDTGILAKHWLKYFNSRVVWGSDWPHAAALSGQMPQPEDNHLLELLRQWAPDERVLQQVLLDNPTALYGFPPT